MDYKISRGIIEQFSQAAHKTYSNSYAYEAGYLQSVVLELLEQVPADVCFKFLQRFEKTTKELNQKHLVDSLTD